MSLVPGNLQTRRLKASKKTIESALWENHRFTIRQLYLIEDKKLEDVMNILKTEHDFDRRKAQYERFFIRWGYRKNLTTTEWKFVSRRIEKRKAQGKESDLWVDGMLFKRRKVQKEITRHGYQTTIDLIKQAYAAEPSTDAPTPKGIVVSTPSGLDMDILRPTRLPFFRFLGYIEECVFPLHPGLKFGPRPSSKGSAAMMVPAPLTASSRFAPNEHDSSVPHDLSAPSFYALKSIQCPPRVTNSLLRLMPESNIFSKSVQISDPSTHSFYLDLLHCIALLSNNMDSGYLASNIVALCKVIPNRNILAAFMKANMYTSIALADALLEEAVLAQDTELAKVLIDSGAHADITLHRLTLSILDFAIAKGNAEMVSILIAGGANVNRCTTFSSPIKVAMESRQFQILKYILRHGADLRLHSCRTYISPQGLVRCGVDALRLLLAYNLPISMDLVIIVANLREDGFLTALLDHNLQLNGSNVEVLDAALNGSIQGQMPNLKHVEYLIAKGGDANGQYENMTHLYLASLLGHTSILQLLLKNGADPNQPSFSPFKIEPCYPLDAASSNGNIDHVQILLNAGTYTGPAGQRALHMALARSHASLVSVLMSKGIWFNLAADYLAALRVVIQNDDLPLINLLLTQNLIPPPSIFCKYGSTLLYLAVAKGRTQVAERLLQAGAEITHAYSIGYPRKTALQAAVMSRNIQIVSLVLKAGGNVNEILDNGQTAIYTAVRSGYYKIATLLLDNGAMLNTHARQSHKGPCGCLLAAAIAAGHSDIVEELLRRRVNVNHPPGCNNFASPLQICIEVGNLGLAERLIYLGADVNDFGAIWVAVLQKAMMRVRFLLKMQRQFGNPRPPEFGIAAIVTAARQGSIDLVELLIDARVQLNFRPRSIKYTYCMSDPYNYPYTSPSGFNAIMAAVIGMHVHVVRKLLSAGAQAHGLEFLDPAHDKTLEIGQLLITSGADLRPYHWDRFTLLNWLSNNNLLPNISSHQYTALQSAIAASNLDLANILLENGADVNAVAHQYYGRTALQAAAKAGSVELVRLMLEKGAVVNAPASYRSGATALQLGAANGNVDIVQLLLEAGADINAPGAEEDGRTALQAAAEVGSIKLVRLLLAKGANVNAPAAYSRGATALQFGAANGNFDIVQLLLEAGADVNALGAKQDGRTALEAAAEHGRLDMVQYILDLGANIEGDSNKQFWRALKLAEREGHRAVVKLIQEYRQERYER